MGRSTGAIPSCDAKALPLKNPIQRFRDSGLAVDDESMPTAGRRGFLLGHFGRHRSLGYWLQSDNEGCATAGIVLCLDRTAMRDDDAVTYRQADAGALADRSGGEEGVEDPWSYLVPYPGTGV